LIVVRTAVESTTGHGVSPGTVVEASGERLVVQTGDGTLRIVTIQPEGRRAMTAREFLAGHPFPAGVRLR
jgi:methionyl-tRNA formyltransferase